MRRLIRSRLIWISAVCKCVSILTWCPKFHDFTLYKTQALNKQSNQLSLYQQPGKNTKNRITKRPRNSIHNHDKLVIFLAFKRCFVCSVCMLLYVCLKKLFVAFPWVVTHYTTGASVYMLIEDHKVD